MVGHTEFRSICLPDLFYRIEQLIPLFVLSECHPPSPSVLRNPGLVDAVHRVSGRSRNAPRKLATADNWSDASQMLFGLVGYLPTGVNPVIGGRKKVHFVAGGALETPVVPRKLRYLATGGKHRHKIDRNKISNFHRGHFQVRSY